MEAEGRGGRGGRGEERRGERGRERGRERGEREERREHRGERKEERGAFEMECKLGHKLCIFFVKCYSILEKFQSLCLFVRPLKDCPLFIYQKVCKTISPTHLSPLSLFPLPFSQGICKTFPSVGKLSSPPLLSPLSPLPLPLPLPLLPLPTFPLSLLFLARP